MIEIEELSNCFERVFGAPPYEFQKRAWDKMMTEVYKGGALMIKAPTASGKTEAAIFPYLYELVRSEEKFPRLIYVMPNRSLVEHQADRIRRLISRIYLAIKNKDPKMGDDIVKRYYDEVKRAEKDVIRDLKDLKEDINIYDFAENAVIGALLCPNDLLSRFVEKYAKDRSKEIEEILRRFRERIEDKDLYSLLASITVEYGLKRTHAFLGKVIISTLDSFIYGLAARRTISGPDRPRYTLPAGAIGGSIVVFDEVQMYQDKYNYVPNVLLKTIEILREGNVPIVIITATFPEYFERMLEDSKLIFPLVCPSNDDKSIPKRGDVKIEISTERDIESVLEEKIEEIISKRTLIICNTVRRAQGIYKKLKDKEDKIVLLHSRFTLEDRRKKSKLIKNAKIIVSTQVVEAGLDLPDVSFVITELAPIDAIIQRIGRCARRPGSVGSAIIVSNGSQDPYPRGLLEKTKEVLNKESLERALSNIEASEEILKEVYAEAPKAEEDPDVIRRLYNFYLYFKELKLFSAPPEINLQVRPEIYTLLYYLGDSNLKTGEEIRINPNNYIYVNFEWLRRAVKDKRIRIRGRIMEKERKFFLEDFSGNEILPYETYVLDNSSYDPELGITLEKR